MKFKTCLLLSKNQSILYAVFLLIFLLLLVDVFLFKTTEHTDNIDHFSSVVTRQQKHRSYTTAILFTKAGLKLQLPDGDDYDFADTCKLIINRSTLFNIPVSVSITESEKEYHFNTTILNCTIYGKIIIAIELALFMLTLLQAFVWKRKDQSALYLAIIFTSLLFLDSVFRFSSFFIK